MGKIVWLASYPKSGNTWMRTFIHNLMRNPKEAYDINKITDLSTGDSVITWYKPLLEKPWQEWTPQEIADARWQAQRNIVLSQPDNIFVKTHNAMVEYLGKPLIHMDWTAAAIYIVRNPLDVCISLADHYGVTIDDAIRIMHFKGATTEGSERIVYEVHTSWSNHALSWTQQPHPGLLVVRYEDMLHRPMAAFRDVCNFLRLTPPKERLENAIQLSSFKSLKKQEENKGFRERSLKSESFFRVGKSGQWREILSQEQVDRVIENHKEQMQRFRYWPI